MLVSSLIGGLCIVSVILFLPALSSGVRIMPLGDSITQGAEGRDSYRRPLWHMLRRSNKDIDFVGSMYLNYPAGKPLHLDFDMDHEGHWGWRADEILARLDGWAAEAKPDIVLVHLGTNDIYQEQNNKETVDELHQIIQLLRKHNPEVKVVLAQIIPAANPIARSTIMKFNDLLPDLVGRITTPQAPVILVDHFSNFDARVDTYDGIHPNGSGIRKMAERWYEAVRPLLDAPDAAK